MKASELKPGDRFTLTIRANAKLYEVTTKAHEPVRHIHSGPNAGKLRILIGSFIWKRLIVNPDCFVPFEGNIHD